MDRKIIALGSLLILLGGVVFFWKVWLLEFPIRPLPAPASWQVELRVAIHGRGEVGTVRLAVPLTEPGQRTFAAWSSSGHLDATTRRADDAQIVSFGGWMEDFDQVAYVFRIERFETESGVVQGPAGDPPPSLRKAYTRPAVDLPSTAPPVRRLIDELDLPVAEDRAARIRSVFAFVRHEVAEVSSATDDALLTLVQREGSEEGRVRLLVSLLRAIGIPARVVLGLELGSGRAEPRHWAQLWWSNAWVAASPSSGALGSVPLDWVTVRRDGGPLIESVGVRDASFSGTTLRAQLGPEEVAAVLTPVEPAFEALSLYRLPVSTQAALRILLLLPFGALITSIMRNVVGMPSYGTFMPMLIALALSATGLAVGLLLIGVVLALGIAGRIFLERLRLLLVPRLSILLCLVVVVVLGVALATTAFDAVDFYGGVVLPIVILAMLIERFSLVAAEEGIVAALRRGGFSLLISFAVYPVFVSDDMEFLAFTYPELILVVIGLLVFLGSYTGYRVTDWLRFRQLARRIVEDAS